MGTFGRSYADFLDGNGLYPFTVSELTTPEVLARNAHWARYAVMHDMFHVLLGAGPDLVGEMKVYGFSLTQRLGLALWLYFPVAWLVIPLLVPHRIGALVRAFREGYRIGRRRPTLMAERLENCFEQDLDEVRRAVGMRATQAAGLYAEHGQGERAEEIDRWLVANEP